MVKNYSQYPVRTEVGDSLASKGVKLGIVHDTHARKLLGSPWPTEVAPGLPLCDRLGADK